MTLQVFERKSAFIPFIMAGYPTIEISIEAIKALIQAGADAIELGIPFTDPIADGETNQRASLGAIQNGTNIQVIFHIIRQIRSQGFTTPIILFSYFNPIYRYGEQQFCIDAQKSGANGLLVVDLPPLIGHEFYQCAKRYLDIVLLASFTTCTKRLTLITAFKPLFVYAISGLYVTGTQQPLPSNLPEQLHRLKQHLPEQKIVVGFGISTPNQAHNVSCLSDGVVIGSELIRYLEQHGILGFQSFALTFSNAIHKKTINLTT